MCSLSGKDKEAAEELSETLLLAEKYIHDLNGLKVKLEKLQSQITTTYQDSQTSINKVFSELKEYLCKKLDEREKQLLDKAAQIRDNGLEPLHSSGQIITNSICNTEKIIAKGSSVDRTDTQAILKFLEHSTDLGNLPALPHCEQAPYICFYYERAIRDEVVNFFINFGEVFKTPPVKIDSIQDKPGALLVSWDRPWDIDSDYKNYDIEEFRLQRTFGDVVKNPNMPINYIDCYRGPKQKYMLRDIQICQPYTFRVCCKFSNSSEWSPWSFPQVGLTKLTCLAWKPSKELILTNDNKILMLKENSGIVAVTQERVRIENSVEFTILESDPNSKIILGLTVGDTMKFRSYGTHMSDELCVLIDSDGRVFIDGCKKRTNLPNFSQGTKVCFKTEKFKPNQTRIDIECDDKGVTYYWDSDDLSTFAVVCHVDSTKWKVMIE